MDLQERNFYTFTSRSIYSKSSSEEDISIAKAKVIKNNSHCIGKIAISSTNGNLSGVIVGLKARVAPYGMGIDCLAEVKVMGDKGKPIIKTWVLSALVDLERYEKQVKLCLEYLEKLKDPLAAYYNAP